MEPSATKLGGAQSNLSLVFIMVGKILQPEIRSLIDARNFATLRLGWTLLVALTFLPCARAVSPLTTDDADTVEPGRLQLNCGWQLTHTDSISLHTIPINPVLGLSSRGELGATFGYQWRDGLGSGPGHADADGIIDLALATKWRLWQSANDGFKLSARLDLKLPAASARRGLGTGETDAGAALIATHCWGHTCLDWNIGYVAVGAWRGVSGDDQWFLGQAVRQQLSNRWTLIGEIYSLLPQGSMGARANVTFRNGAQFTVRENLLVSALIGSTVGRNSPGFVYYVGFTRVF